MQNSRNLEPILTTLVTGDEDAVFDALISLFPVDQMRSNVALTDCLTAFGEGAADVFTRFATRLGDDVARAEFLISAASHTRNSRNLALSDDLSKAASPKVRELGNDAELERAKLLNDLGYEHYRAARFAEAEPLFTEALSIHRRVLGADHPDTATCLNNLAGLYRAQGRVAEAATMLKEAVEIMVRVLGVENPNTKIVRENYEGLLAEMKEKGAE